MAFWDALFAKTAFPRIPSVGIGHPRLPGVERAIPSVKLSGARFRIKCRIRHKSSPAFQRRIPSPRGCKGLFLEELLRGSERLCLLSGLKILRGSWSQRCADSKTNPRERAEINGFVWHHVSSASWSKLKAVPA